MKTKKPNPECFSIGECFARKNGHCTILSEAIEHKECPFRKPLRLYTNGKFYPFNHEYEQYLKEMLEHAKCPVLKEMQNG